MLDADTKRRIDTARDLLVGKVPDPKSQVEQITIALIYKIMDAIDAESEEFGGQRSFFAGDFERYRWPNLVGPGRGGQETLNLYAEALGRLPENPELPPLFRRIFDNAFLPYRDPETLREFLKVIDEFPADDPETLGDPFEYLLSVLGAQGDAGQFRTPRHIIDFIVQAVDPQKDETILDPACGTGGFLIAARQHILNAHSGNAPGPGDNGNGGGPAPLTPDEMGRLAANLQGYDISPDMVRLARVNLYLHSCPAPQIHEYDTLTSEERWDARAEVILANPPFMSPKGGIRPHGRFAVKAKRSEVLFVDYIAEHLTAQGRAGVIVPEGVIFQSQHAYRQLRKMLVEQYLTAVVSLPAGVFQPYSGVKTSILFLDRARAARSGQIALLKAAHDGYDLGAQRRPIDRNDLPEVLAALREWREMDAAASAARPESWPPALQALAARGAALVVDKARIAADGDYNLSGERYRERAVQKSPYEIVPFKEVCTLEYGASLPKKMRIEGPYPVIGSNGISGYHNEYLIEGPAIVVGRKGSAGEVTYVESNCFPIDTTYYVKPVDSKRINILYLYHLLKTLNLTDLRNGAGVPGLNRNDVYEKHTLPLPPLEAQRELVSEIEGYQRVIDGARAVVDNYRPHIAVDPAWPTVALGEVCEVIRNGYNVNQSNAEGLFRVTRIQTISEGVVDLDKTKWTEDDVPASYFMKPGDVLFSHINSVEHLAKTAIFTQSDTPVVHGINLICIRFKQEVIEPYFAFWYMKQDAFIDRAKGLAQRAVNQASIKLSDIRKIEIPLPPLGVQQAIAGEIAAEQGLVAASRELAGRMAARIGAAVGRAWGGGGVDRGAGSCG